MKSDKELYRQLRVLSCERLWSVEVPAFDRANPRERMERVAVVRAVGVVFSAAGSREQRAEVRAWLGRLLNDPSEKIRRYAMAAMPKIGAGAGEEAKLLSLLQTTTVEREKKFLGQALDKIGGEATLEVMVGAEGLLPQTEQKVKASVARRESPSSIRLDSVLSQFAGLRIHLRCRRGLETIARDEVKERTGPKGKFRIAEVHSGLVVMVPVAPFSLSDVYAFRCFGTLGFDLGTIRSGNPAESIEALAAAVVSPVSRILMTTFTEGSLRYRLDFVTKGHQRGAVRRLANRAYALCPEILNDARSAPWAMDIHPTPRGTCVELRPKLAPDPRFYYRTDDVPAASHPPLAACMARLAGRVRDEIVWDPFCGSGLELVESALLGGVQKIFGTDLSPEAVAISQANLAAAKLEPIPAKFICCDFRDHAKIEGLGPESVTLIVTNPPMGRRIRVQNMHGLFDDLFTVAADALKPGGRLVFANPLRIEPRSPSLKMQFQQVVDLGGFDWQRKIVIVLPPNSV